MLVWMRTYCVDRSQREGEVEVVAVVDVSVLHEPQIFISHHLHATGKDISEVFYLTAATNVLPVRSLPDRCSQASSPQKVPSSLPYAPDG